MDMSERDEIVEALLIEGLRDWSYLGFVHSCFASGRGGPKRPVAEVQRLTLDFIRECLEKGWIVLGVPVGLKRSPRFDGWDLPVDEAMAKIECAYIDRYEDRDGWRTMVWIDLTADGEKIATALADDNLDEARRTALLH